MRLKRILKLFNDLLDLAIDSNLEPGGTLTIIGPEMAGLKIKADITFHVVDSEDMKKDLQKEVANDQDNSGDRV